MNEFNTEEPCLNPFTGDPPRILVADDQPDIVKALRLLLKSEGFAIRTAASPEAVLDAVEKEEFEAALIDLNYARDTTSGQEGVNLIKGIRKLDTSIRIIVMTAWAMVDLAVECMREGACDFVQKPWDNARLASIARTQAALAFSLRRQQVLEDENRLLRQEKQDQGFIARDPAMQPILDVIERVAPSDASVLITGENGSGKGVVARALHGRSNRADRPFVSINMGGLASGVAESELFGHVKGAFTDAKSDRAGRFEMADGGTLFLDEIANMPMEQQNKLLRVLETGEFERVGSSRTRKVNARIICATNAELNKEVAEGRFRQDLLFRLNTIPIHLPPLRERPQDIQLLAEAFLVRHRQKYRKDIAGFTKEALDYLLRYDWPGNVRELDHCVERSVLLARGADIQSTELGLQGLGMPADAASMTGASPRGGPSLDDMSLEDVEKYLIERTLKRNNGNATQTAKDLGLSRSAFYRRLEKHGL